MNDVTAIVVLAHNGLDITKRFIHALYKYTTNFHLILIDNASTDGTKQYLEGVASSKSNIVFAANDKNLGVIGGRNQGYDLFRSLPDKPEYLVFLDNDQICQSDWLQRHHAVMAEGKYGIVGVEAWLLNSSFWPTKNCKRPGEPFTYVGCGGMMVRASVPEQIGMFDPQFNPCYFEDPDFAFRARQAGIRIGWNYKSRLLHVPHQTLGKNSKRWHYLRSSHAKFREKWKKTKMPPIYQVKLECLESIGVS